MQAPIVLWFEFKWQRAMALGHEALACKPKGSQSPGRRIKVAVEDSSGLVKSSQPGSTSPAMEAYGNTLWAGEKLQAAHRGDNHERRGAYPTVTVTDDLAWYRRIQATLPSFGVTPGGAMQDGSGI